MFEYIIYFSISFFATTIGAISGIGGGIIIKPLLDFISVQTIDVINFLSGCTVLSMAVVSVLSNRKSKIKLNLKTSSLLAAGAIFGGFLGQFLFDTAGNILYENDLKTLQSTLLIVIMLFVFIFILIKPRLKIQTKKPIISNVALTFIIGAILGIISSFLGIGGGPFNVIILNLLFAMDTKTSVKNSIFIILFAQVSSLITVIANNAVPNFEPILLLLMITGGICGGILGNVFSHKIRNKQVDFIFKCVIVLIIILSFINLLELRK